MFTSRSFRLYAPLNLPDGMRSKLVLGATDVDISGGDALVADETLFEKIPQLGHAAIRSIYWETQQERQTRIVVREIPVGWRGDMYSLYLLSASIEQASFLDGIQDGFGNVPWQQPMIQDSWRPPLVFRAASSGKMWILNVGEPYQELADWTVYAEKTGRFEPICRISFTPDGVAPVTLLPKQVRALALLLDKTLGTGEGEGTQQPTARLRVRMQHVWANAAIRPWALEDADAYNSRTEIDAGLRDWAEGDASAKMAYKKILRAYPQAEKAMSRYYSSQFGLPGLKAAERAKWVLDIAFRSSFTFPRATP